MRELCRFRIALALAISALCLASPVGAAADRSGVIYFEPTAAQYWAVNGATILSSFDNGQCTQWAASKRPDIVQRGVTALVAREIAARQGQGMGDWTAKNWPRYAAMAGIPTGHTPQAGAIMALAPGVLGASPAYGHVAYVESVSRDGSFRVSQMNAPILGSVTYATFTAADAQLSGVTFIYRSASAARAKSAKGVSGVRDASVTRRPRSEPIAHAARGAR